MEKAFLYSSLTIYDLPLHHLPSIIRRIQHARTDWLIMLAAAREQSLKICAASLFAVGRGVDSKIHDLNYTETVSGQSQSEVGA